MLYLIGAGGHAKTVIALLHDLDIAPDGCFDDAPDKRGATVLGVPVLGPIAAFADVGPARAVIAVGGNAARKAIDERFPGADWLTLVSPHARVHASATIGTGSVVFDFAVVQGGITIGRHAILNVGTGVGHDASIGDYAHVAGGAYVGGEVVVGEGAFLGLHSSVCPCVRVGAWATLGAGSAAHRDVPPGCTAIGVPARRVPGTP